MAILGFEFHPVLENIWPMTSEQYKALEQCILRDGRVLDPIVIWKGTKYVVDGHNRLVIAEKHKLKFQVVEMEFDDVEHAAAWSREHQCSRRNVDPGTILYNVGKVHAYYSEKGKEEKLSHVAAAPTKKTAAVMGVSESTVLNAVKHAANVDQLSEPVKNKYLAGELSASVSDVQKLAALPKPKQTQAAKLVESGQVASISQALKHVAPPEAKKAQPSIKSTAAKVKIVFADVEMQRTFDAWKKMMAHMPTKVYRVVEGHCSAIYKELVKYQEG